MTYNPLGYSLASTLNVCPNGSNVFVDFVCLKSLAAGCARDESLTCLNLTVCLVLLVSVWLVSTRSYPPAEKLFSAKNVLLAKSEALSANDIFICPVLNENSLLLGIIKNNNAI